MKTRVVITGAAGLLGRCLAAKARTAGRPVVALTSADWDITDAASARDLIGAGDVVINCAAYTQVDRAEKNPDTAQAVNAVGPGLVAAACARAGADFLHVSTDYVFGAREQDHPYEVDDPTAPVNVYGRSKLAGERAVLAAMPAARVVRTAWVFAGGGEADFVSTMRRLALADGPVDVVADQVGSPTYVGDLAAALLQVADTGVDVPVVHAVNTGAVSRYELARAVFALSGADPQRVRPVSSDRHPRPAPRPRYSALADTRSVAAGLAPLRNWRDALALALTDTS